MLRVAVPVAIAVAGLTLVAAPWAYRQIGEYHERFEQRSDLSKVTAGPVSYTHLDVYKRQLQADCS